MDQLNQTESQENNEAKNSTSDLETKFENESYSQYSLMQVQRARLRGKMYGVNVPYLNYHLHKPETKRKKYTVFGAIITTLAALVFVAAALFLVFAIAPVIANSAGSATSPQWDIFHVVDGLSGMAIGLALILLGGLFLIVVMLGVFLMTAAINCFHLASATKEEIAYGPNMNKLMWQSIGTTIIALIMAFFILFLANGNLTLQIVSSLVFLVFAILLGVVAGAIIRDKITAIKWFKAELTEEQKQNYLEHTRALARVKLRKENAERIRNNMFWR